MRRRWATLYGKCGLDVGQRPSVAKRNKPKRNGNDKLHEAPWDAHLRTQQEEEDSGVPLYEVDYSITPENILSHIAALAFFDPRNLQTASGQLRPLHKLDRNTAIGLAGVDVDPHGVVKYRYVSRNEALKLLMDYKRMLLGDGSGTKLLDELLQEYRKRYEVLTHKKEDV